MAGTPVQVGIIGCGAISGAYLGMANTLEAIDIVACADLMPERACTKAEEFSVPIACTVDELLANPDIEIVLNLTIPRAHADVALAAIAAGKHVYNEKPLTVTREEGRRVLEAAQARGVLVGSAPDTFLGAGLQTCRTLIDDGVIGQPIGCTAFMLGHGHEGWHPDPEFYYQKGGGPMFDMGPYYLTALTFLMGPTRRVTGANAVTFSERTIGSEKKRGQIIPVEVPTHVVGVMEFASGAIGSIITSFDVWASQWRNIEIYGTLGTMIVPDPNGGAGPVQIRLAGETEWREAPLTHHYAGQTRSLGAADMACALREGRPHRASGEMAYHVLDIMHAFHDAAREGTHITLESTCAQPDPLLPGATL
jgi:predicted dehydrogenase